MKTICALTLIAAGLTLTAGIEAKHRAAEKASMEVALSTPCDPIPFCPPICSNNSQKKK